MALDSPSSNDSLLHQILPKEMECLISRPGSLIFLSFYITITLLILPICIFVLYLGLQRWRQQSSTSSTTSHSDIFTFHMVLIELLGFLGFTLCVYAVYVKNYKMLSVGFVVSFFTWYVQNSFHILTCVERYLAVVHPVTYLNLKGQRGVRIRNICIGCVWLLSFAMSYLPDDFSLVFDLGLMIFSMIVVSFFSLSVLCILIRPGPGEQGGDRTIVDQSKRRAFFTIVAILGVLLVSSLVLPLLFLHRVGKLACCKNNNK
ncbi:hypothetical protein OYC64_004126 [Pagothenia borchgrevinki]|uniref:G-protein coupled receptors family 1 profile domain-containing protein n=1 Tax=Pagothenia borchgrevinki TaxID=8213 RepID=A0ABD2FYL4_PAGBO